MKCGEVKKLFPDYLMMEIDPEVSGRVEGHIAECEACRMELENSGTMWTKLEVLPVELPGGNLKKKFYRMLEEEVRSEAELQETKAGWLNRLPDSFLFRRQLFSPAAILLFVISGFIAGFVFQSGSGILKETLTGRSDTADVRVISTDEAGVLNMIDAYTRLRSGGDTGELKPAASPVAEETGILEFFAGAAFSFADYFEKIITL